MNVARDIRVLPVTVANKIAAGEVVERPSSVVKELVENAIDSGATQIDVEIVAGGRKLVSVSDNGCGMNRDNALLSVERHATSKIRDVDDIEAIASLGFRGEALAAISSVSRFRLVTCRRGDEAGTEISISGGKLYDVGEVGCPAGTTMQVRDLFFNVPARRKFLRTQQTELSHIRSVFTVLALSHTEIGMTLTVDGREVYGLAAATQAEDRLRELFGPDYLRNLRPVRFSAPACAISGFVSVPAFNRADRGEQYLFVNGRSTGAALLNYAVREGYHTLLPSDRHPCVFLFVQIDPGEVDVNVHPTKKEVRFRHPGEVRDAVIAAIREALAPAGRAALEEVAGRVAPDAEPRLEGHAETLLKIDDLPPTRVFRYPRRPSETEGAPAPGPWTAPAPRASEPGASTPPQDERPASDGPGTASPWAWCRVLGQIGGLYVLLETEDGFVIMDPHAAHERILYERFMRQFLSRAVPSQALLMPQSVELRPADTRRVREGLGLLREMGFGISEFGADTFVVDAMPACFAGASCEQFLIGLASAIEQAGARGGRERWKEETIAQAACKAAVKARDKLTLEEIEQLVVELARAEMPYTCPHGRPTVIFSSFKELHRKFGRER